MLTEALCSVNAQEADSGASCASQAHWTLLCCSPSLFRHYHDTAAPLPATLGSLKQTSSNEKRSVLRNGVGERMILNVKQSHGVGRVLITQK